MSQPPDPSTDALVALWTDGAADIDRRLQAVWADIRRQLGGADVNRLVRLEAQAARLEALRGRALQTLDGLTGQTRLWVRDGNIARLYEQGAGLAGFGSWTAPHRAAVEVLSTDLFSDVLAVTRYVDDQSKRFTQEVGRKLTGFKLTSGTTAKAQARRLEQELRPAFERRGMTGVRYADGSLHSFGEYSEMLIRTKTAVAYNAGTLNQARAAGIRFIELLDGANCGLTSHHDPQLANGLIVDLETAQSFPIAHPNCRRSMNPRPDVTDPNAATSVQSPEARADQKAFEEALAAQRARRPRRDRRDRRPRDRGAQADLRRARALNQRADNIARARALLDAQRAEAVAPPRVDPELLNRWGVTEDQYLNAKAITDQMLRDIREAAGREADDLGAWLFDNDLSQLAKPSRKKLQIDPLTGRRRYVRYESGYDWMEQLSDGEMRRVATRYKAEYSELFTPDVLAEQVRLKTNADFTDGEAMDWLVDRWLQEDAYRLLSRGRIAKYGNKADLLPSEWQMEGYDIDLLFGQNLDDAVGHVAQVQADAAKQWAARSLPEPRLGEAPWRMEMHDYIQEMEVLEQTLVERATIDGTVDEATDLVRRRIRELAPVDLDDGAMSLVDLYEQIRLTAQQAGREVWTSGGT